ncbi:hypothetical protein AURDEDRAFT_122664 [Auricularia subglabra TFB-10046 SS5]|nr:hypothetical protein AURDEDRAFT_122664 [Auricularia subglabra TFB-10046 SS5]
MRLSCNLVHAFLTVAASAAALPSRFPKFELVFTATVSIFNASSPLAVPEGSRFRTAIGGGEIKDPRGKKVGEIVPGYGSETGYVDNGGIAHLDAKELWHFSDGHFAITENIGPARIDDVGAARGITRLLFETDSPTYEKYNGWMLMIITRVYGSAPNLHLDIFGADPAALPK